MCVFYFFLYYATTFVFYIYDAVAAYVADLVFKRKHSSNSFSCLPQKIRSYRTNDKRVSSSHIVVKRALIHPRHEMHCLFVLITDGKTYDPGTTAYAEK